MPEPTRCHRIEGFGVNWWIVGGMYGLGVCMVLSVVLLGLGIPLLIVAALVHYGQWRNATKTNAQTYTGLCPWCSGEVTAWDVGFQCPHCANQVMVRPPNFVPAP